MGIYPLNKIYKFFNMAKFLFRDIVGGIIEKKEKENRLNFKLKKIRNFLNSIAFLK
jgi:hypothetical protein